MKKRKLFGPSEKEIKASLRCEYCGEHGHTKRKCQTRKQDKRLKKVGQVMA